MSIQGSAVLLKKGTVAAGVTIGGMRTTAWTINSETVDTTTADNVNKWRELLANAGIKNMSITMSGVLDGVDAHKTMVADVIAATVDIYGLIVDDFGSFEGAYQLTTVESSGEYNGEATFSITLESGGDITFTPGA